MCGGVSEKTGYALGRGQMITSMTFVYTNVPFLIFGRAEKSKTMLVGADCPEPRIKNSDEFFVIG